MSSRNGLPPLFPLRGFQGSLADYIDRLHWQYRAMLHEPGVTLWGRPVIGGGGVAPDGRDACFWHLVTQSEPDSERRTFNLRRAASIPRTWAVLEMLAAGDPRVVWWRSGNHLFAATADWRHFVAMTERRHHFVLKTAFPLDAGGSHSHEQRARTAWSRVWLDGLTTTELFAATAPHTVPSPPPRRKVRIDRVPPALERVAAYL